MGGACKRRPMRVARIPNRFLSEFPNMPVGALTQHPYHSAVRHLPAAEEAPAIEMALAAIAEAREIAATRGAADNTARAGEPFVQVPSLLTHVANLATRAFRSFQFLAGSVAGARILALSYFGFVSYYLGREDGRREGHAQGVDDMAQQLVTGIFGYGCRRMCYALLGVRNTGLLAMETETALAPVRTYPWDQLLSYSSDEPDYECGMERALVPTGMSYPWHRPV